MNEEIAEVIETNTVASTDKKAAPSWRREARNDKAI